MVKKTSTLKSAPGVTKIETVLNLAKKYPYFYEELRQDPAACLADSGIEFTPAEVGAVTYIVTGEGEPPQGLDPTYFQELWRMIVAEAGEEAGETQGDGGGAA